MDKIQIMVKCLTSIVSRYIKERNYANRGQIRSIAIGVFEKYEYELIDMFFDDIIDEITKLGNITQEELLDNINYNFGCNAKSIKALKEHIIKRVGYHFLLEPINYLIYWDSTRQGRDYWDIINEKYKEKLTFYNKW